MKNRFLAQGALAFLNRLDPLYPREASYHGDPSSSATTAPHAEGAAGPAGLPFGLSVWHYAFILALLSGLSMPIGAVLGFKLRPDETTVAKWIALGAGALLFAVAVELYGHAIHSYRSGHTSIYAMVVLLVVSIVGSVFFTWVSRLIEGNDEAEEAETNEETHDVFATGHTHHSPDILTKAPSQHLPDTPHAEYDPMETVAAVGDKTSRSLGNALRQLKAQNQAKAKARWRHIREAVNKYHIIKHWQATASARLDTFSPRDHDRRVFESLKQAWGETKDAGPSEEQLSHFQKQNRAAALTMLTMLLVDGVPEGILMGLMAASGNLGITFILSLSIANFPEAFAGGVMMDTGGFTRTEIVGAWSGLMLLVGTLSGLSCYLLLMLNPTYSGGHNVPLSIQILVATMEGMAGGAMISGISACMLPEAFERRDKNAGILSSNGFLTTFGFLLSVCLKISLAFLGA